jgi:hypothetical protein
VNQSILRAEVQQYIQDHLHDDVNKIALSKSPFIDVSSRELAEQIDGKKRAEKKLPSWYQTPQIIYPAKLSIEQSSSEATGEFKSRLLLGDKLIDLTGGFGVDDFYFSRKAKAIVHFEQNAELSAIAEHNLEILGVRNMKFLQGDSIEFLASTAETFDTIYVDPSRRVQAKKVFLLKDTEPDVISALPLFLSKAKRVLIKTSPLFDIQSGLKELTNVREVHVISLKNDCKELVWVIDADFVGEPLIVCTAIKAEGEKGFRFRFSEERSSEVKMASVIESYLYEPDVALLKAGCFKSIANQFQISKLHINTHLYTSGHPNSNFIGKIFLVDSVADYKTFSKEKRPIKANVVVRNFPHTPDELKKKHKLSDGGDQFLIFTTLAPNDLKVISARLVSKEAYSTSQS